MENTNTAGHLPALPKLTDDKLRNRLTKSMVYQEESGCLIWKRCTNKGYGCIKCRGIVFSVSRLVYFLTFGLLPQVVRHTCDNPACCNPAHLLGGTQADNMRDKYERNRQARGETNGRSKLTEAEVLEIRSLQAQGMPVNDLANRYGVTKRSIYNVMQNNTWRHVKNQTSELGSSTNGQSPCLSNEGTCLKVSKYQVVIDTTNTQSLAQNYRTGTPDLS